MERSPLIPASAWLLSLTITLVGFLLFYFHTVNNHQQSQRETVNAHAQRIVETLDRHFSLINLMLQHRTPGNTLCSTAINPSLDPILQRPEVIGIQMVDQAGYLRCENGSAVLPAIKANTPVQHYGLRFTGPRLIPNYDTPVLMLARTRLDGSELRVILHPDWLRNRLRNLTSQQGFVMLVDSDSGVPVIRNGQYSLPIQHQLFPLNSELVQETHFDNLRTHYLYALPLVTQPNLAIVISEDSEVLDQYPAIINLNWLVVLLVSFCSVLLLVLQVKRRLSDPARQLRSALRQRQFINAYQPLVHSRDFSLAGVEVLMRWRHPVDGIRCPDTFIPVAEETGLIRQMTIQQLHRVCQELAPILEQEPNFKVSINICPPIINDPETVCEIIQFKNKIPGMVLEITEHQMLEESETTAHSLKQFKDAGFQIAIDDFGTGYCGLSYLQQMPLDILKADRCFIAALGTDAVNADLLETIIQLARKLNLVLIAEGVEEPVQAFRLQSMGVEIQQGWYHGRPMSPQQIYGRWELNRRRISSKDYSGKVAPKSPVADHKGELPTA